MKFTIDLSDELLLQANAIALEEGTTLNALAEKGLQHVISELISLEAEKSPDGLSQ